MKSGRIDGVYKISWNRFDLTYEGLKCHLIYSKKSPLQVLILPMRDWNAVGCLSGLSPHSRFDLTYEGLKCAISNTTYPSSWVLILPMRDWNLVIQIRLGKITLVLILPMRDWNTEEQVLEAYEKKFWSYLWGIEITFDSKAEALYYSFWSYLWGIEIREKRKRRKHRTFVLILPMRDWNLNHPSTNTQPSICFDLTYEGLKYVSW